MKLHRDYVQEKVDYCPVCCLQVSVRLKTTKFTVEDCTDGICFMFDNSVSVQNVQKVWVQCHMLSKKNAYVNVRL